MIRLAVQSAARAGAQKLLDDYAAAVGLGLRTYRSRPALLKPPQGWIDRIDEDLIPFTLTTRQRIPRVVVKVAWGLYDSGAAVDQRDRFIDGFLDWVADNYHAFGTNTDVNGVAVRDDPSFTPDWIADDTNVYLATEITLEGFAAT